MNDAMPSGVKQVAQCGNIAPCQYETAATSAPLVRAMRASPFPSSAFAAVRMRPFSGVATGASHAAEIEPRAASPRRHTRVQAHKRACRCQELVRVFMCCAVGGVCSAREYRVPARCGSRDLAPPPVLRRHFLPPSAAEGGEEKRECASCCQAREVPMPPWHT